MATFLCLPNEIILQVVETTEPDDIENLGLCCKRVYDLAGSVLKQHRKHKRMFSSFNLGLGRRCCDPESQAAYAGLHDLSKSRYLQLYPKAVEVESFVHTGIAANESCICDNIFRDYDSPYLSPFAIEFWRRTTGCREPMNCLLLTLLPNVRNITVWENDVSSRQLGDMIDTISRINNGASQQILGKLSLVKLQEADIRWNTSPEWWTGVLEAFMSLPSLKVIRGRDIAPYPGSGMRTYPNHFSNVTQFHFRSCALPEWYFAPLVRRTRALQVFSYDHCQRAEMKFPRHDHRPEKHMESLYTYAEETLVFLNYTSDAADDIGDHREPDSSMLDNFKALKTLRISRVLLIVGGIPQRLVDELPSSLEELELVEPITTAEAQRMLDGMLAMKRERCPNLRLIVFEGVIPLDHDQIVAYERMGLVLDWRNTDTNTIVKTGQKWLGGIECERC